uniref:Uncharacterized protein n=1 Tax=candidate division WOR-3 bacterium TaxID=2052148 RepID=A0A7C4CBN1_UNCW3
MTASGWRKSPRGVETRVLDQMRQALEGVALLPAGEEHGRRSFAFTPKATILDPAQTTLFTGRLETDAGSGFPLAMVYGDQSGRKLWRMEFSRFNRAGKVWVPFVPDQTLNVSPSRRLSSSGWSQAVRVLRGRLGQFGVEHRVRRRGNRLEVSLTEALNPAQSDLLFSVGRVELWEAEWTARDSVGQGGCIAVVGGDVAQTARLRRLIATNGQIAAKTDESLPVRPELIVTAAGIRAGALVVLLVDGVAVGAAWAEADGQLRFAGLGRCSLDGTLAAVANNPVLPVEFRAVP